MGQTLTHGVYLPDEGERNCYNGLAGNWQILDSSVGTIAEHTTALAGKAPAVHTHAKSDITDFPAYGTTAGTICEGNDSRLSDARTPTAHTHTKSDVTDLLNSNFIPSANNSYDLGTSDNKWKTLNGVNPGALSFPDLNTAQTIDRTGWVYDGSTYNSIKLSSTDTNMTKNGWLYVRINSTGSSDKLSIKYNSIGDKYPTNSFGDTGGCIEVFVPIIAGLSVYLCATKDLQFCKFYPCLGNVPSGV